METSHLAFFSNRFAIVLLLCIKPLMKRVLNENEFMSFVDIEGISHQPTSPLHFGQKYEVDEENTYEMYNTTNAHMIHICQTYIRKLIIVLYVRSKKEFDIFEGMHYYDKDYEKLDTYI